MGKMSVELTVAYLDDSMVENSVMQLVELMVVLMVLMSVDVMGAWLVVKLDHE